MTSRRKLTPRPALSARELDRVQKELRLCLSYIEGAKEGVRTEATNIAKIIRRFDTLADDLTRVLGMLARSERR